VEKKNQEIYATISIGVILVVSLYVLGLILEKKRAIH